MLQNIFKDLKLNLTLVCDETKLEEKISFDVMHETDKEAINAKFCVQKIDDCFIGDLNLSVEHETSHIHKRFQDISLSFDVEKSGNFVSLYNYNGWWTRPSFSQDASGIPLNTQALAWENDELSYVILTLCGDDFLSSIYGKDGKIHIGISANTNGYSKVCAKTFILASNADPYKAYSSAMKTALKVLDTTNRSKEARRYPKMFNYLGFCTWNAFYDKVDLKGVIEKADEFTQKKLPVKWFLIDHGWSQQVGDSVSSRKEDFNKFPGGLKKLKEELQKRGIPYLGVWQGFGGHWGTVKKDSEMYWEMKDNLLETNTGHIIPYPSKEKSFAFWNAWHKYLKQNGVDFVKVDIQSSLRFFTRGAMSIGKASKETHIGLEASVGVNFDGAIINCMGMGMEQVLNRPVSAVSRNSNDFFPHKDHSFKKHVYENAYNSLYHGEIYYGDFDMWWTNHPDAINNSYLRALSGGPLYVSDKVDDTVAEMLLPHVLDDGYILRTDTQGIVTRDQVFYDPTERNEAVKVCSIKGKTGYIGAFNCNTEQKTVTAKISPLDVQYIEEAYQYVVYNFSDNVFRLVKKDETIEYTVKADSSIFMSITPVVDSFAFVGAIDKLLSSAMIEKEISEDGVYSYVLKQGGKVAFYSEKPVTVSLNGKAVDVSGENGMHTFDCSAIRKELLVQIVL